MQTQNMISPIELQGLSALDLPLQATFFNSHSAAVAHPEIVTLRELAGRVLATTASLKSELPWIKLARFGEHRTPKGSLRNNANVLDVSGVELDYDVGMMGVDEAVTRLRSAGIAALVYTSPSHLDFIPRWRVLAPCSTAVSPVDRERLAGRINAVLGGVLSLESFTLSQGFYFGGLTDRDDRRAVLVEGAPIDTVQLEPVFPVRVAAEPIALPKLPPGTSADQRAAAVLQLACGAFDVAGSDVGRHQILLSATRTVAPYVLAGLLDEYDAVEAIEDAMRDSGREANGGEVESAIEWGMRRATAWTPPSDGSEFDVIPVAPVAPASGSMVGRFVFPADCATSARRGYLIKHLLAPGDVGALIGPPSTGKSVLAPHLAYAVAQGRAVFGLRTKPGRVLYAAAEDGAGMRQRIRALFDQHGDAPDLALVDITNLRDASAAAELNSAVAEWGPALVVIDTLGAAWAGLDENSSTDMGEVVALARRVAATGCAVLLVHHIAKAGDGSPRGHSVLNGTLDMCLALGDRGTDGVIRARLQKNRNGTPDRDIAFRIAVAELGQDEDGDTITAPVAAEVTAERSATPKLNRQQGIAWAEFQKIEVQTKPDAAGKRAVSLQEWKDACAKAALSSSSNRDSQRTSFNRTCGELYRLDMIAKSDDYAWRVSCRFPIETTETNRDGIETVSVASRDGRDGHPIGVRPVSVQTRHHPHQ